MARDQTSSVWLPVTPFGASSSLYRALQRRAGILARREALKSLLLEEGLGRRLLLVAPPETYGDSLVSQGWAVTRLAWPATAADVRSALPAGTFDAIAMVHVLGWTGDPFALLKACVERLAKHGRFIAIEENQAGWLGRKSPRKVAASPSSPHQRFTVTTMRQAAHDVGLSRAMVFTSSCGLGPALLARRGGGVWRAWVALLDPVLAASPHWGEDNGEEVVLWAMR